jgi:nitrite reductase/ring-hydroxylating ferredoxin subunit
MATGSKIRYFFILLILAFLQPSCENNKNDVIPDTYTDFTIDISGDIFFSDLNSIGMSAIVTSQTNNWGSRAGGYDFNGIIVYRANLEDFFAYDRTCPHDYAVNSLSIKVRVDFTQAICPQCSTYYELSAGGISSSGPGKYPLKNYRTGFDGRYVRVSNY